jgi:hypothetical protein
MRIPLAAIRSLHSVPEEISFKLDPNMSIHGLLAAELAVRDLPQKTPWVQAVPTQSEVEECMPLMWPEELQALLPPEAAAVLAKHQSRFQEAWDMFSVSFPDVELRDYRYAWFLVNSRTFYYETPETLLYPWHDRLALLPLADLLNHADSGCRVAFSTEGYAITTDRAYRAGEEVCFSYGEHSNDFLLAEYGFLLEPNRWDTICLNHVLQPRIGAQQHTQLSKSEHQGPYLLSALQGKRDDTEIALRVACGAKVQSLGKEWEANVEDAAGTLEKARKLLPVLVDEWADVMAKRQEDVASLTAGSELQRTLLSSRWKQIGDLTRQLRDSGELETWF